MTVVISREKPESFSAVGCAFTVLDDGAATDGRFGAVHIELSPGWGGPPQHIHREHDETFYVLSGAVRFTSGRDELLARPGQLVIAPIGDPHTFANADTDTPSVLICTITPEKYLDYFRELAGLTPGTDGRFAPQQMLELMSRYATEPYRPSA